MIVPTTPPNTNLNSYQPYVDSSYNIYTDFLTSTLQSNTFFIAETSSCIQQNIIANIKLAQFKKKYNLDIKLVEVRKQIAIFYQHTDYYIDEKLEQDSENNSTILCLTICTNLSFSESYQVMKKMFKDWALINQSNFYNLVNISIASYEL